jgi:hypothetical protein
MQRELQDLQPVLARTAEEVWANGLQQLGRCLHMQMRAASACRICAGGCGPQAKAVLAAHSPATGCTSHASHLASHLARSTPPPLSVCLLHATRGGSALHSTNWGT